MALISKPGKNAGKPSVQVTEGDVFSSVSRVSIVVSSVIIDRFRGASFVDVIFDKEVNLDYLVSLLQNNPKLREEATIALRRRIMGPIFTEIIGTPSFRAGGLRASKSQVFNAVSKFTKDNAPLTNVLTELIMPTLIANDMVNANTRYAARRKVDYVNVKISHIADELLKVTLKQAFHDASRLLVIPAGTHSTAAVSDEFAEGFAAVGTALTNINQYEGVLHDIVLGVLGNLDVAPLGTQRGSVPSYLRDHEVVQQLMTNLNFIRAALEMRTDSSGLIGASKGLSAEVSDFLFDRYARVVLTMLRDSDRYQMISKSAYLSTVGCAKVVDLRGIPTSTVLYDNVGIEATAMAVIAIEDMTFPGALNLEEMPDRVSERMESMYGSLPSYLNLPVAASYLTDIITALTQDGVTLDKSHTCRMVESESVLDKETLALLAAERVVAEFNEIGREGVEPYRFIYTGQCKYQALDLQEGSIIAGTVVTPSADELLLAIEPWDPSQAVAIPPQLIPRSAVRAKLVGLDKSKDFVPASERGGYKIDANGIEISGSIKLKELSSIRMGDNATLVTPHHNASVVAVIEKEIDRMVELSEKAKTPIVRLKCLRLVAQYTLEIALSLAPSYRAEVHGAIVDRAASKLTYEESIMMRANLRQQTLTVLSDILAATIFFKLQGLSAKQATLFDTVLAIEEVRDSWIESGSDR